MGVFKEFLEEILKLAFDPDLNLFKVHNYVCGFLKWNIQISEKRDKVQEAQAMRHCDSISELC